MIRIESNVLILILIVSVLALASITEFGPHALPSD